jgi:hypothetical protein
MTHVTVEAVDQVCDQFRQEGISLEVVHLDSDAGRLELRLDLSDVECADCVMPAAYLERLIATSLERRWERRFAVLLHDPRSTAVASVRADAHRDMSRDQVVILDPTVRGRSGNPDPGPDAGDIRGRTVLFRVDTLWRSWDWVVDEWSHQLRSSGATVQLWRRSQGISGEEGRRRQAEYEAYVGGADIVISGLANCGSCTAWTVRDALTALNSGVSTVAVATEHFAAIARTFAEDGFRPGMRLCVLPYPLDVRPEAEVRAIARAHFEAVMSALGAKAGHVR